jgi:chromosome segregation ATPase
VDVSTGIALGAVALTVINTIQTYLRARPLVPASELESLRAELGDLRARLSLATSDIAILKAQLGQAITEREWWKEQYKQAKEVLDRVRHPLYDPRHLEKEEV